MSNSTALVVGAAAGGALLWLAHRAYADAPSPGTPGRDSGMAPSSRTGPDGATPASAPRGGAPATPPPTATADEASGLWIWPIAIANSHRPVVSDGFGSPRDGGKRKHEGVDLMFKRAHAGELTDVYPPKGASGTSLYFMPDDCLALAASRGRIWSAYHTTRGYQVAIDHGRFLTLYQHLTRMFVDERHEGPGGPLVEASHPLGVVGGDPTNPPHLRHLHFELRLGLTPIDPEPFLRRWQLLEIRSHAGSDQVDVALRGAARTTQDPALA